jgi:hypothetical protein
MRRRRPGRAALQLATQVTRLDRAAREGLKRLVASTACSSPSVASGGRTRRRGREIPEARPCPRATMPGPARRRGRSHGRRAACAPTSGAMRTTSFPRSWAPDRWRRRSTRRPGLADAPGPRDRRRGPPTASSTTARPGSRGCGPAGSNPATGSSSAPPNSLARRRVLATLRVGARRRRRRDAHRVRARRIAAGRTVAAAAGAALPALRTPRRRHAGGGVDDDRSEPLPRPRRRGRRSNPPTSRGSATAAGVHLGTTGRPKACRSRTRTCCRRSVGDARPALDRRRRARPRPPARTNTASQAYADPAAGSSAGDPRRL